jgi:hypothetical protein
MKLLLNDKEIAAFLVTQIDLYDSCKKFELQEFEITNVKVWIEHEKARITYNLDEKREAFKKKIGKAVRKDLARWMHDVKQHIEVVRKDYKTLINKHTDYFINARGEDRILNLYKKSNVHNFVKSTGLHIDSSAELTRRKNYSADTTDCLFRNTIGNEKLILSKIDNSYPFWFIDSGYTNFVESNKKWHRLVRNHIHFYKEFEAPVDRLGVFNQFPKQWRTSGEKILVIEPGPFAAGISRIDLKTWKYGVEAELRKFTDKKIVFREKTPKKQRDPLYQHLCNEDYYCLVNISSNAATEAIWAGVPTITLDTHITNSVTVNKLSDVNNLVRPNLANWLCMLSYSQFTYEELINGTALEIIKRYHV